MNKLKDNKLTVTMKEALVRNVLVENKMKANMDAIGSGTKKNLQSLEYYKHKYAKRQRELQCEKQRILTRETSSRKISAPSRLMVGVEYKDLTSGGFSTDLNDLQRCPSPRPRSSSADTTLPPLQRRETGGGKLPELLTSKHADLALPTIDVLNVNNNGRQGRLSASNLYGRSLGLTVPTTANTTQAKSAPSSPCMPRRPELARVPSARGRSESSVDERFLLREMPDMVLDLEEKIAKVKESQLREELEERKALEKTKEEIVSMRVPESKDQNPRNRKISSPGTVLRYSSLPKGADDVESEKTLEEKMNNIRYCKYLRTPSLDQESVDEGLPDQLVPKVIIVGHTDWVPGE